VASDIHGMRFESQQPLDFILVLARLLLGLPATDDTEDDDDD
jgi:hypothetical protein